MNKTSEMQKKANCKLRVPPLLALNVTRQKTVSQVCVSAAISAISTAPTRSVTDIHSNPVWDEHETACIVLVSSVSRLKAEWCLVQNCSYSNIADRREDYSHAWVRKTKDT
jgi:hypothetical protein